MAIVPTAASSDIVAEAFSLSAVHIVRRQSVDIVGRADRSHRTRKIWRRGGIKQAKRVQDRQQSIAIRGQTVPHEFSYNRMVVSQVGSGPGLKSSAHPSEIAGGIHGNSYPATYMHINRAQVRLG